MFRLNRELSLTFPTGVAQSWTKYLRKIHKIKKNFYFKKCVTAYKVSVFGVFWSLFSCIQTEYSEILRISPYSVRMQENADQENAEYEHFSCSMLQLIFCSSPAQLTNFVFKVAGWVLAINYMHSRYSFEVY